MGSVKLAMNEYFGTPYIPVWAVRHATAPKPGLQATRSLFVLTQDSMILRNAIARYDLILLIASRVYRLELPMRVIVRVN